MKNLRQRIERQQDLNWVRKFKAGDPQAFRSLVERYQRRIYTLVRGLVGSHSLSDDVTQETFVKVFEHIAHFDETYPFFPWLRRIAVNSALTALQNAELRKKTTLDETIAQEPLVDGRLEQAELLQRLQMEVDRLPEEQRLVFVLRTQQEMSYQEIAAILNISVGTVMSRLNRCRTRLRERLQDYI